MAGNSELTNDSASRLADALDKLRTDSARHLRKYGRRIKVDGEAKVKAAFAANPDADPEVVADEALAAASRGWFLTAAAAKPAITAQAG